MILIFIFQQSSLIYSLVGSEGGFGNPRRSMERLPILQNSCYGKEVNTFIYFYFIYSFIYILTLDVVLTQSVFHVT